MKKRYFKQIEIDTKLITSFLQKHPNMAKFVNLDVPFFVRVSKKPYPGLIHTIISQNENNDDVINKWNQLLSKAKKIKIKNISNLSHEILSNIVGQEKANLIKEINNDILSEQLKLESLQKQDELTIVNTLGKYKALTLNSIQTFLIFSCFKQNVLCDHDEDFITGLKIFLNKENIDNDDIKNITIDYMGQLTLFSLCMWKIRNERSGR